MPGSDEATAVDVMQLVPHRTAGIICLRCRGARIAWGMTNEVSAKTAALAAWLSARGSVLVGVSGGVDSALLAVTATDVLGVSNVLACWASARLSRAASMSARQRWRDVRPTLENDSFRGALRDVRDETSSLPETRATAVTSFHFIEPRVGMDPKGIVHRTTIDQSSTAIEFGRLKRPLPAWLKQF
jgi:hypothetical protein